MSTYTISLSLVPGSNAIRVACASLLYADAENTYLDITAGTIPDTGVLISCDTPLFTLNGVLEPGGIVLAPVSSLNRTAKYSGESKKTPGKNYTGGQVFCTV